MPGFDAATAVHADDATTGRYIASLDAHWTIGGKPNGGYLLAVLGRAVLATVGASHPHPVAASAHYVSTASPGPAEVEVTVLRKGRSTAQATAVLRSEGQVRVAALFTCGRLEGGVWWDSVPPPDLPAERDCPRLPVEAPGLSVPLMGVVAERLDPATLRWLQGQPSGRGELKGWVRFDDGRDPDPLALLAVIDVLPPATFDLGLAGWVPTLELSCHIRALPTPGPLRVRQRARHVASSLVDEECDVWDSSGRLVATGHQLAGVRLPG